MNKECTDVELKSEDKIEISRVQEITRLHNEINALFMSGLEKAIRIGLLLEEQKKSMAHGKFTSWIERNLPFKERTVRNYMRLYRNRHELKRQGIAGLNAAYHALTEPKETERLGPWSVRAISGIMEDIKLRIDEEMSIPDNPYFDREEFLRQQYHYLSHTRKLRCLSREFNKAELAGNIELQIKIIGKIVDRSIEVENEMAEDRIRIERKMGQIITELKTWWVGLSVDVRREYKRIYAKTYELFKQYGVV